MLCLQGINSGENNIDDFCKNHPEMFQNNVDDTGLCNDKNRFINACRKVKELLLANSISPDYFYNRRVPNISHISRLFALFMYDEVDDKRLAESVEALREFKVEDKDKGDYKWQCSEDLLFDQNDNIYSILDQLLEDISSDELESDLCSYCTVKRFIQDIKESRQQILLERQIKEYIIKFDKTIKYCDKDSFAKALRRTYELEGLDESIIDAKVEESMEESTKRANNCFMNTAANFFVNDMNLQNVEN